MSDRGEFRSIHTVLIDGPDFQGLTPHERLMVFIVKMSLGASGIDVVPSMVGTLCERTGLDEHIASAVLDSLEESGWIQRERNILWLVDGLQHDPGLTVDHIKHRKGLRNHVRGMPRLAIVRRFIEAYREWFDDAETLLSEYPEPEDNGGDPKDSLSAGASTHADTLPNKGKGKREKGRGIREEEPSAADASVAEPSEPPPEPKPSRQRKLKLTPTGSAVAPRETWLTPAQQAWDRHCGAGSFPAGKAAKYLAPIKAAGIEPEEIGHRLAMYLMIREHDYRDIKHFAEHHGEFSREALGPAILPSGELSPWADKMTAPAPAPRARPPVC